MDNDTRTTHHDLEDHAHDLGLSQDLPVLLNRRRALGLLTGAGLAAALAACDGSNGVNVLTESGIVRSDLTTSFGTGSATANGVPLTLTFTVLDTANGAKPLAGAAVYAWHCDAEGRYSMYSDGVTGENYLRGVQESTADGTVTFTSIYPAAYQGRWPHVHLEVYPRLADATKASGKLRTTQLALPEDASRLVYKTAAYPGSTENLDATSLEQDMVFADGWSLQLGKVSGDVAGGMAVTLNLPV